MLGHRRVDAIVCHEWFTCPGALHYREPEARASTTDLGFIYRPAGFRCGWLHPTPLGERYLPFAAGVAPAMRAEFLLGAGPTLHADLLAACDQEKALELELRHTDGALIETTDIGVIDTRYLLSIADAAEHDDDEWELSPEEQAEIDEMVAELKADEEFTASEDDEETEWPPRISILTQRRERIHPRRPPRRQIVRDRRHAEQRHNDRAQRQGIAG